MSENREQSIHQTFQSLRKQFIVAGKATIKELSYFDKKLTSLQCEMICKFQMKEVSRIANLRFAIDVFSMALMTGGRLKILALNWMNIEKRCWSFLSNFRFDLFHGLNF